MESVKHGVAGSCGSSEVECVGYSEVVKGGGFSVGGGCAWLTPAVDVDADPSGVDICSARIEVTATSMPMEPDTETRSESSSSLSSVNKGIGAGGGMACDPGGGSDVLPTDCAVRVTPILGGGCMGKGCEHDCVA